MAADDEILANMLDAVPDIYDKRPGSFIYDALAPAAEQFSKTDESIESVNRALSIENLSGEELAKRINERTGIVRKGKTKAKGQAIVTGTGTIKAGDLFETKGGVQFQSIETKSIVISGAVQIEAVMAGSIGNVAANTITLFPVTLTGFTAVNNPNPTTDGFEDESDADLLQRYYDRIRTPATSGNRAHYKNWAREVSGVGDARVIPLWNGNNTVKVVIINSDKAPASAAIVAAAQSYIDPGVTGLGDGAAPIGAFATIVSATAVNLSIAATIILKTGYTLQQATDHIAANLSAYLKSIAFVSSFVSYAKIGSSILDAEGVDDYTVLTVNGGTSNINVGNEQVAVLGAMNIVT